MQLFKLSNLASIIICVLLSSTVTGASLDSRYASATCDAKKEKAVIECDYRHSGALNTQNITARIDKTLVQIAKDGISNYPSDGQTTAILFLVDTSDPSRKNTVEKRYVSDLFQILSVRKPHHKIGISSFDTDVKVLAPLGTDDADILNALAKIKAEGQATEFYKSVLEAITTLKGINATRKGLVILSDGKDEDRAYKSSDVVSAAKDAGVVVLGLGYSERPADAPYLQNLKRLADETQGQFLNLTDQKRELELFKDPYSFIDGGGRIIFSSDGFHGKQNITLLLGTGDEKVIEVKAVVNIPDTRTLFQIIKDFVFIYWGFIVFSLIVITLIIYLAYRYLLKRKFDNQTLIEYAYLVESSGSNTKYSIKKTAIRIGRGNNNDIVLTNDSISTHHAEIHKSRDGSFNIVDLGSTNGVFVNDQKVVQKVLSHGDQVELGEVRLKFFINLLENPNG